MPVEIASKIDKIFEICREHKVKQLYVFGSVSKGNFDAKNSDVDLIVEIDEDDPFEKGEILLSLWNKLEELINRKVDLLTTKKIENPFFLREIESSKLLLYDRAG